MHLHFKNSTDAPLNNPSFLQAKPYQQISPFTATQVYIPPDSLSDIHRGKSGNSALASRLMIRKSPPPLVELWVSC